MPGYITCTARTAATKISSVGRIIRLAFGRRLGSKQGLNRLRAGTKGSLAIAFALSLLPEFLLALHHDTEDSVMLNRRIAAGRHLYIASSCFGTRANRRSERADGLHFGS